VLRTFRDVKAHALPAVWLREAEPRSAECLVTVCYLFSPRRAAWTGRCGTLDVMDDLYREVILDHYKNPRGHGALEDADARAEGMNPLCGDEVTIAVAFKDDGDTIGEVRFEGRGCAISQAATSMLMEMVEGRSAEEVATMPKEELLEELGIPLTPVRLKCALLGLGVLKVALHRSRGTPLPEEWVGADEIDFR
jgi:nitrogen fixation NifU-like protein